mmetsp:Transcript_85933/g.246666  ORF Transcript_85933/g.246666 Transcript_85933/m.246666 type:complete len:236 (-) Transcript_85933:387-1094(-)
MKPTCPYSKSKKVEYLFKNTCPTTHKSVAGCALLNLRWFLSALGSTPGNKFLPMLRVCAHVTLVYFISLPFAVVASVLVCKTEPFAARNTSVSHLVPSSKVSTTTSLIAPSLGNWPNKPDKICCKGSDPIEGGPLLPLLRLSAAGTGTGGHIMGPGIIPGIGTFPNGPFGPQPVGPGPNGNGAGPNGESNTGVWNGEPRTPDALLRSADAWRCCTCGIHNCRPFPRRPASSNKSS